MGLGYDVVDDDRDFEKSGITGNVTRYTEAGMTYPCYIVQAPFEKYKIQVLQSMFQKVDTYDEDEANLAIQLYFEEAGQRVSLGKIYPRQVKSFLQLFSTNKITGYFNSDTFLEGDMLYVLSS